MASRNPHKPNILFILSDDQGPWALGCAGNPELHTPHLDKLAQSGMRFTNFFCASPVCSPARATLLTGRMPSRHGIHDWLREGNTGEGALEYLAGQETYTDYLAAAGYRLGLSGKWHLGDSIRPQKGFSHWYVHQKGGGPYYGAPMIRDGRLVTEEAYITDLITDDALTFIDSCLEDERPFYAAVHYTAPHSPWVGQHPQEIVAMYKDCPFDSCPQEPLHPFAGTLKKVMENPRPNLMGYFAAITAMDRNIGRLLNKLDELHLRESTLVFFTSDNGFNCGHHGFWGKGNGTFPLNMYDNSVKVPAIVSQPGRIPAGLLCEALVSGYDVFPTILEYTGMPYHPSSEEPRPGRSFAPLLSGEPEDKMEGHGHIVVCDEYGPVRMVRTKEWKYVHRYPYGPHELYHLSEDPAERHNLIDDAGYASVAAEMKARLEDWFMQHVDPAVDGVREPVTGAGQIYWAGVKGRGRPAYAR
ncbi:MAG TPA: sulfatase-like hydrolase/transferase [Firmicutes bacterium]|nr:sulfatase-like hydrolase/transferase [Bacillota bacterium]